MDPTEHWKKEVEKARNQLADLWTPNADPKALDAALERLKDATDGLERDVGIFFAKRPPKTRYVPELLPLAVDDLKKLYAELQKITTAEREPLRFHLTPGWSLLFVP